MSATGSPVARALTATALAFVALGLALPILIDTPPFALYREALEAGTGGGVECGHAR